MTVSPPPSTPLPRLQSQGHPVYSFRPSLRINKVQEAAKLLRAGQHVQAHERINKVLAGKPSEKFVVLGFDQDYRSSNLSNVMRKRQYWVREGARWKILYEDGA